MFLGRLCSIFTVFQNFRRGLFRCFALVFLQLFLQCVNGGVDGLLKSFTLLTGKQVLATKHQTDVGNLVLGGVDVVEFECDLGIDHLAVPRAKLFHFLRDEVFKFLVSLEVN